MGPQDLISSRSGSELEAITEAQVFEIVEKLYESLIEKENASHE